MRKHIKEFVLTIFILSVMLLSACGESEQPTPTDKSTENKIPTEAAATTGETASENTNEFSNEDENYIISCDGEDNYIIPEFPRYTADRNVSDGIEIDSTLASAIRQELGYESDYILTLNDLESILSLYIFETPVTSVKGISLLKNLSDIRISSGYIDDINELTTLENLVTIDIANCYIKDIPDLSGCSELTSLYLCGNLIEDISPLSNIPSLRYVSIESNHIRSIEPIKDVEYLELLAIQSNCILDYDTISENASLIAAIDNASQSSYAEALYTEHRAKEIVSSLPEDASELQKEAAIYKYVMETMVFDDSMRPSHAYGYQGLIEGSGVCGDYAEMFCLLANHAGIETYMCFSDDHAWNIVRIDGTYYHCDALWDENMTEWTHFNKSTCYMLNLPSHTHDLRRYPICEESMSPLAYCDYMISSVTDGLN